MRPLGSSKVDVREALPNMPDSSTIQTNGGASMSTFRVGRFFAITFLAMPGLAYSMTGKGLTVNPSSIWVSKGAANWKPGSMSIDSRDSTAVFGGYNNSTSALAATAADGAGHYAVVGTSGTSAYLAVYNSGDHSQVCQTTFVPVDPFDPLHIYDQGRAFGVAYGAGAVYVAGEAHDTTSTSDDFDGFGQGFNPATCAKVGSVVIEGGPDHDAFKGVAVGASGVILAGYIHLQGDDQFLAERWSADLSTNSYAFFYPITGTAGGNHTNAVATDALGNAWVFGFLHLTPAGTDQRLELHALDPSGSVVGGSFFFAYDISPSQYTAVKRRADRLL